MKKELSPLAKRFLEAIEKLGLTGYAISKRIPEISQATMTHIRAGRNEPSKKVTEAFLMKYNKINPRWLYHGVGNMTIDDSVQTDIKTVQPEIVKRH